jgi:multidrug efflux system outer membrane protein
VADALAERSTLNERLAAQQALTEATVQSYRLSQARYTWATHGMVVPMH